MTPQQAKEALGIGSDVQGKDLRRAYLKKVRQHKPEQDPEGFKRIRQAFELLDGLQDAGAEQTLVERPERADDEGSGEPADEQVSAAGAMLSQAYHHAAEGRAEPALTAATEALSKIRDDASESPYQALLALDVGLELHSRGAALEARQLGNALRVTLGAMGAEAQVFGAAGNLHILVAELDGLPDRFPSEVRTALAEALLVRDISYASEECWMIGAASRLVANEAAHDLVMHAPLLAGAAVPFLNPGGDPDGLDDDVSEEAQGPVRREAIFGMIVAIGFALMLGGRYYAKQQQRVAVPRIPQRARVVAKALPPAERVMLTIHRDKFCSAASEALCEVADDVVAAVRLNLCDDILVESARLAAAAAAADLTDSAIESLVQLLKPSKGPVEAVLKLRSIDIRCVGD